MSRFRQLACLSESSIRAFHHRLCSSKLSCVSFFESHCHCLAHRALYLHNFRVSHFVCPLIGSIHCTTYTDIIFTVTLLKRRMTVGHRTFRIPEWSCPPASGLPFVQSMASKRHTQSRISHTANQRPFTPGYIFFEG